MQKLTQYSLYLAWTIAIISTLGSLFFSEVWKLPPCVLCWYQRIFMYPLVFLIPVAIIKKDKHNLPFYVLPMVIIGSLIAFYHNLLYYKILPEAATPCISGVSCTTKYFEWFGFITIPLLSLLSFIAIAILMVIFVKYQSKAKNEDEL